MEYGDEQNIKNLVAAQAKRRHNISNEVTIDDTAYTFERRRFDICDTQADIDAQSFSMIIPKSFLDMPKDIAKKKFPNEDRPKLIVCSKDYRVCFAFNCREITNDDINTRLDIYRNVIKRVHSSDVFLSQNILSAANDLEIGFFDYIYAALDNNIYNATYFADLPGAELLGWFMCPAKSKDKWEPLLKQMVESLEIVEVK